VAGAETCGCDPPHAFKRSIDDGFSFLPTLSGGEEKAPPDWGAAELPREDENRALFF
jgi:hypothetical protein